MGCAHACKRHRTAARLATISPKRPIQYVMPFPSCRDEERTLVAVRQREGNEVSSRGSVTLVLRALVQPSASMPGTEDAWSRCGAPVCLHRTSNLPASRHLMSD